MIAPDRGAALAQAARDLVGVPFRLHGRDPATGLDCVGVLSAALTATGQGVRLPSDYSLRMVDVSRFTLRAADFGFVTVTGPTAVGDVVLFQIGPYQYHMAIADQGQTYVHAHAGLRRVVNSPALIDWSIFGHWRLGVSN